MFSSRSIEIHLAELSAGESLKDDPVICSAASSLALEATGKENTPQDMIEIGEKLASFRDKHGISPQVIQHALLAAEPSLCAIIEGRPDTY